MSHTPGPWKVSMAIFDGEDSEVGYVLEGVKEASSDDAALIEAAPYMYEVLEQLERIIHLGNVSDDSDDALMEWFEAQERLAEKTEKALKKARGCIE